MYYKFYSSIDLWVFCFKEKKYHRKYGNLEKRQYLPQN